MSVQARAISLLRNSVLLKTLNVVTLKKPEETVEEAWDLRGGRFNETEGRSTNPVS
jgi:hypothetical protein